MINAGNLSMVTRSGIARGVKQAKQHVKKDAFMVAVATAGTGSAIAVKNAPFSAINGGFLTLHFSNFCNSVKKLVSAKQMKSEHGVSYSDILERAKNIYNK